MHYRRYLDIIIRDFSAFAGQPIIYLLALFIFALGEMRLFWQFSIGVLLVDGISIMIRLFKFRDRPMKITYANFLEKIDASSFPSIHAGRSILMFAVFSNFFANTFATIIMGSVAAVVCYSRIYLKRHYISDVIAGVVLGAIISYFVLLLPATTSLF